MGETSKGQTCPSAVVDCLEAVKSGGLITRYEIAWEWRGDAPKILVCKAADLPDAFVKQQIVRASGGVLTEAQVIVGPS